MHSTARILVALAFLPALGLAQERLPDARLRPITTPVRDAGSVDVTTGRWARPDQRGGSPESLGSFAIYNNTCTWSASAYFAGFEPCEENYDEGRVPGPDAPKAPCGAEPFYLPSSFQVSYCTSAGPLGATGYDMDVAFYDKLLGDCVGGIAPTPPPVSSTATAYFGLAGLGLPGSTAVGSQACWVVTVGTSNTGWVLAADGDGSYDGNPAEDKFIWMQRQNTWASPAGYPSASPDGFFIAGDPHTAPYGSCSFNIPCGTSSVFGNTCGTGLDTFDGSWVNVDGIAAGSTAGTSPPGCPNSIAQYGFGTNCYFFGGYPTNPFASYHLVLKADRQNVVCGQANSCGCDASLTSEISTLSISGSNATSWRVRLTPVPAASNVGILIYGANGVVTPISTPFGTLCIDGSFRATSTATTPLSVVGGCVTPSSYDFDFGSFVATNAGQFGIVAGNTIDLQAWYRDPPNPGTANFSDIDGQYTLLP